MKSDQTPDEIFCCPSASNSSMCIERSIVMLSGMCPSQREVKGHHLESAHSFALQHNDTLVFACQGQSLCDSSFCGAGRECAWTDAGEPVCRCLQVRSLQPLVLRSSGSSLALCPHLCSGVMRQSAGFVAATAIPTGATVSCTETPASPRPRYTWNTEDAVRVSPVRTHSEAQR